MRSYHLVATSAGIDLSTIAGLLLLVSAPSRCCRRCMCVTHQDIGLTRSSRWHSLIIPRSLIAGAFAQVVRMHPHYQMPRLAFRGSMPQRSFWEVLQLFCEVCWPFLCTCFLPPCFLLLMLCGSRARNRPPTNDPGASERADHKTPHTYVAALRSPGVSDHHLTLATHPKHLASLA